MAPSGFCDAFASQLLFLTTSEEMVHYGIYVVFLNLFLPIKSHSAHRMFFSLNNLSHFYYKLVAFIYVTYYKMLWAFSVCCES